MRIGTLTTLAFITSIFQLTSTWSAETEAAKFTDTFIEEKSDLVSTGRNPFFILEPGYTLHLLNKDGGEELVVAVLNETKMVDGVETRIVEEREGEPGKPSEISRNYFAISKRTGNVYYFGEETRNYKENGEFTIGKDSWESGKNGARYGLLMPGCPLLGSRYYQEVAPDTAMDRAENVSLSETFETPAGIFQNCLKTEETSPLEPRSKEYKLYAPGVSLIRDGEFTLVRNGVEPASASTSN